MTTFGPKELIQNKFGNIETMLWPSSRDESWKYNKIDSFYSQKFGKLLEQNQNLQEHELDELTESAESLSASLCPAQNCVHLFLFNGTIDEDFNRPALKRLEQLGVEIVFNLRSEETKEVPLQKEPRMQFVNRLARRELLFKVSKRTTQDLTIQLVNATSALGNSAQLLNFKFDIMEGASLRVIESQLATGTNTEWRNIEVLANLGVGSGLTYIIDQHLNLNSYLFHSLSIEANEDSKVEVLTSSKGGALSRFDLAANVHRNADVKFFGLTAMDKTQKTYHNTAVIHLKEFGKSEQLYKAVLDGKSQSVFAGRIRIERNAQAVNSKQYTKSLLMSEEAESDAKPALEIYADDVKANHGATVGQLDDAQIFYLQSRGITKEKARQLVATAFFNEVVDKLESKDLKTFLKKGYK